MNIKFLEPARDELVAAAEFYKGQAAGLGANFLDEVELNLDNLRANPRIGSHFGDKTRRILLQKFPYQIIYTLDPSTIIIIAVAHLRRKPGYWSDR